MYHIWSIMTKRKEVEIKSDEPRMRRDIFMFDPHPDNRLVLILH